MDVSLVRPKTILTRTTGYLKTVTTHSLQPYRGCSFGRALCGLGCYVQHNRYITEGRKWGSFLEVKENAAELYLSQVSSERGWAQRQGKRFTIFLSSSTEPFLPQESKYQVTRQVLKAMLEAPPDGLVVQTHSHRVSSAVGLIKSLSEACDLRVHISIETDLEKIDGMPAHASSIASRLEAAQVLKQAGIRVVITISPLLPIAKPNIFFARLAQVADAVVLDHYIGGDGSRDGARTRKTMLPAAMYNLEPRSTSLSYRDEMVSIAMNHFPGRVGTSIDGFAGRF